MDILKQFTPEQLKALSPEQIRAIMGTSSTLNTDILSLKLFVRGINGNDSVGYREDFNQFRETLLRNPNHKFYIVSKYVEYANNKGAFYQSPIDIMGEDEMRARCPHIDYILSSSLNDNISPNKHHVSRMVNGITNVHIIESQILDTYEHLAGGYLIMQTPVMK